MADAENFQVDVMRRRRVDKGAGGANDATTTMKRKDDHLLLTRLLTYCRYISSSDLVDEEHVKKK